MDPNAVILEISSDEETVFDDGASTDDRDDHNWIADILGEVNKQDCWYDDSDEVVVVNEVLPVKKPRKKLIELDDDCVILDRDPDKPNEPVENNDPIKNNGLVNRQQDDDSDDDLLVVSEKGQVACRDYPHSRHLCIKFPFSSTPNQNHCDQCYCYVCDSLAPCMYWGNGSGNIDHCLATDKDDFWRLKRQNFKTASKNVNIQPINLVSPALVPIQTPSMAHNQFPRPNSIRACPLSSNFQPPNIINQNRALVLLSRNKFQPSLVSQQLTRTSSRDRVNHNYNLNTTFNKPEFKRTVSAAAALSTNLISFSSCRENYRNQFSASSQTNNINNSVPFSPPNVTFEEPVPRSNPPFDFSSNFQPQVNPDPFVETPVLFQPQVQSFLPNYSIPVEASEQESQSQSQSQSQKSTVDPKFFNDISWQQNAPELPTGSGVLADYDYDNWLFNNHPPCETGSATGLNEFSSESGFIDTENGRRHW